ncbi:MAG: methyltransferase domain-containing protein [Candidatus Magasanikbacteria bacterium]|nr:methyltransferase domain-containing protein [Candidatus Magasanikbacteria bacterium]
MMLDTHFYAHEPAGVRKQKIIAACLRGQEGRGEILDIGCGVGHLSAFMASLGFKVTAVDEDAPSIALAKEQYGNQPGIKWLVGSVEAIRDRFDFVTAFEVCEHVPELDIFLERLKTRLKPGGQLIISVPNGWSVEELGRRFMARSFLGKKLKVFLRRGLLPKTNAQSAADSPHVRWWGYARWVKIFNKHGLRLKSANNVAFVFKQFYYLGGRRILKPTALIFKFLDRADGILAAKLPRRLADGWILVFNVD